LFVIWLPCYYSCVDDASFCQRNVIVAAYPFVIESIDELIDKVQADPAGPGPAARSGRERDCYAARIVRLAIIRDLYRENAVRKRHANLELMQAAVGPTVFADVAYDFIKNDLQFDQWLAADAMLGGETIQRVARARRAGPVVVDNELDGLQSRGHFGQTPLQSRYRLYTPHG
jgi:hypothetical protein